MSFYFIRYNLTVIENNFNETNADERYHIFGSHGNRDEFLVATCPTATSFRRRHCLSERVTPRGVLRDRSGHIRIFKSSSGGRSMSQIEGPASSIAELPVFDGGTYPASGTAIDDVTVLFSARRTSMRCVWPIPRSRWRYCEWLGLVFGGLSELLKNSHSLRFGIAWPPSYCAPLERRQADARRRGDRVTISNQELAAQIGTVRELVSRILSRLQAEGVIKIDGPDVIV